VLSLYRVNTQITGKVLSNVYYVLKQVQPTRNATLNVEALVSPVEGGRQKKENAPKPFF
jgi:hypothetical protein